MARMGGETKRGPRPGPGCASATDTAAPQVALLSNGRYGVVITGAGSGCSTWRGLDVTRWREDAPRDCWGQFCYLRDPTEGTAWSAGDQPLCRAPAENEVACHARRGPINVSAAQGLEGGAPEYETDGASFLGRGRTPADPAALDAGTRLSGTTGPVLDAVFSLRRRVLLDPRSRASVAFITGVADTREAANALAEQFQNFEAVDRAFSVSHDGFRGEVG